MGLIEAHVKLTALKTRLQSLQSAAFGVKHIGIDIGIDIGFAYSSLDLKDYRTGSMNEGLLERGEVDENK